MTMSAMLNRPGWQRHCDDESVHRYSVRIIDQCDVTIASGSHIDDVTIAKLLTFEIISGAARNERSGFRLSKTAWRFNYKWAVVFCNGEYHQRLNSRPWWQDTIHIINSIWVRWSIYASENWSLFKVMARCLFGVDPSPKLVSIGLLLIIGIDHDTVCAGVVCAATPGTARVGRPSRGRLRPARPQAAARRPAHSCCAGSGSTNHSSADRMSGQFLFYHENEIKHNDKSRDDHDDERHAESPWLTTPLWWWKRP